VVFRTSGDALVVVLDAFGHVAGVTNVVAFAPEVRAAVIVPVAAVAEFLAQGRSAIDLLVVSRVVVSRVAVAMLRAELDALFVDFFAVVRIARVADVVTAISEFAVSEIELVAQGAKLGAHQRSASGAVRDVVQIRDVPAVVLMPIGGIVRVGGGIAVTSDGEDRRTVVAAERES
jgi:hypothetical protein